MSMVLHYKEPLRSFEIRVGHSTGFGFPSVAILPQCAESDIKQYIHIHIDTKHFSVTIKEQVIIL